MGKSFPLLIVTATYLVLLVGAGPHPEETTYASLIREQERQVYRLLVKFEQFQEDFHPDALSQLREDLEHTEGKTLDAALFDLTQIPPSKEYELFHESWTDALRELREAYRIVTQEGSVRFIKAFIESRDAFARARYRLYDLRTFTPLLSTYWRLPGASPKPGASDSRSISSRGTTGIIHSPKEKKPARYSLYVPENYSPTRHWPLVLALHGAGGRGDEFLLTWLRPAKTEGFLVLAPQSLGKSWGIANPEPDILAITEVLASIRKNYRVDPDRILVSGLSDGGTFAYVLAASRPNLFAAVAPIAATLPPWTEMKKAGQLPFLIVHGGRDFIFPVFTARRAVARLKNSGIEEISYRELPDWGHAYTYSINETIILPWFQALFMD